MSEVPNARPTRRQITEASREAKGDALQEIIDNHAHQLRCWTELVDTIDLPSPCAIALATGRTSFLHGLKPEALGADDVGKLYKAIAVLIETNFALQAHAAELSRMAEQWGAAFKGIAAQGERIASFANFHNPYKQEVEG